MIDGPSSLIAEQVESGLVVRMAILYELLAGGRPRSGGARAGDPDQLPEPDADQGARLSARRSIASLDWRGANGEPAGDLVMRRASVLDPRAGIDGTYDVVVRDGEIAELAEPGSVEPESWGAGEVEVIEAEGKTVVPAFFDPHVHLRTPGDEDEEDIETGTRAAAAGGYCGLLAMANTRPPVQTAADIRALRERAADEASVPAGFLACVTRDMAGEELTEMAELRDAGAAGFSDDGLPISNARVLRRALSYQRLVGAPIALHEEDHELSQPPGPHQPHLGGAMHEGRVSAALGLAGIPSIAESTMIARDAALAAYEERADSRPAPVRARVGGGRCRGEGGRGRDHLRGDPAPPDADRRGGQEPGRALQDEPAASLRGRSPGADRRACARA